MDSAEREISRIEGMNATKALFDFIPLYAEGVMLYYKSLMSEGFTQEQSLQIVLKHGMCPPFNSGDKDK